MEQNILQEFFRELTTEIKKNTATEITHSLEADVYQKGIRTIRNKGDGGQYANWKKQTENFFS